MKPLPILPIVNQLQNLRCLLWNGAGGGNSGGNVEGLEQAERMLVLTLDKPPPFSGLLPLQRTGVG